MIDYSPNLTASWRFDDFKFTVEKNQKKQKCIKNLFSYSFYDPYALYSDYDDLNNNQESEGRLMMKYVPYNSKNEAIVHCQELLLPPPRENVRLSF